MGRSLKQWLSLKGTRSEIRILDIANTFAILQLEISGFILSLRIEGIAQSDGVGRNPKGFQNLCLVWTQETGEHYKESE